MSRLDQYKRGIMRRWRQRQCKIAFSLSPKPLATEGNTTCMTLCFDYEGGYSKVLEASEHDEYSCRGIKFILDKLRSARICATFNCVGRLMEDHTEILKRIIDDGHEIASHTVSHTPVEAWNASQMIDDMTRFRNILQPITNCISGFRGPQSKWTKRTLLGLLEAGVLWNAEDDASPYPYIITQRGARQLWRMPVAIDDWGMQKQNMKAEIMRQRWCSCVLAAMKEQRYIAIGFHPWVLGGDDDRLDAFSDFIDWLQTQIMLEVNTFGFFADRCRTATHGAHC